jgi:alkylhydroperoxidase/carboxymuconolactone decarboxylase family protein YurZ
MINEASENKLLNENAKEAERVIQVLRDSMNGHIMPAFERGVQFDPNFFEWFSQISSKFCFPDGKALPAKYRALIHICLLANRGMINGLATRIKMAIEEHGASKLEIVEALETAMVEGGAPTLFNGLTGLMLYEERKKQKA